MAQGLKILQPPAWARPRGYSHGIAGTGRLVFVAGQIGWDEQGRMVSGDLTQQVKQALKNIVVVLAEAGGRPEHIARMTWYFANKRAYVSEYRAIGAVYREIIGDHFPAMTAIEVPALIEDDAKVEIEATAVVPE